MDTLIKSLNFVLTKGRNSKALDLNSKDENSLYNKGTVLFKLNRYEEALICFNKILEIMPDDDEIWYNKGNILHKLERYKEASKCFDKAINLDPSNEEYKFRKGLCDFLPQFLQKIKK